MDWIALVEVECHIKIDTWKRLLSRRNEVYYVEGTGEKAQPLQYVVKLYRQGEIFQEPFILRELFDANVKVPKVIWHQENIMVTEYISGTVLAELMGKNDAAAPNWVEILARWLNQLHSAKKTEGYCLSMPDLNLRNFIFTGKDFFGLDFEEVVFNRPERDLGGISAFILNSDPMFEHWKFDLVRQLIKTYGKMRKINREKVEKYFYEEMLRAAERRVGQKDYLLQKIEEIGKEPLF